MDLKVASIKVLVILALLFLIFPGLALAHEAYVLTPDQFHSGLQIYSHDPLNGLLGPEHLEAFLKVFGLVALVYILTFFWSLTKGAAFLDQQLRWFKSLGPLLIRLAIGTAFFYGALSNSILGPELSLSNLPLGGALRVVLLMISGMILLGVLTEVAAALGLIIFFITAWHFGTYLITYVNYLGELLVLSLFGSRFLSLDRVWFGRATSFKFLEKYRNLEVPIVRVLYGLALVYAGITIKFLHQGLTVLVYNQYHLSQFFKASPQFIASGAGLAEILIGLFIILGFMQRLTVTISLIFITLSLAYFREMVWPHLMLYGISLSLLINSADQFTMDRYLGLWVKRLIFGQHNSKLR